MAGSGHIPALSDRGWDSLEELIRLAREARCRIPTRWLWDLAAQGQFGLLQIPTTGWGLFLWISELAISELGNDHTMEIVAHALVSDPERVESICCRIAGDRPATGDLWFRYRQHRGVRSHEEMDAPRIYVPRHVYSDPDREARRLLWEDPEARGRMAIALGGRISGRIARAIPCPECGRRSVYYYVDCRSNRDRSARCSHRNSCGYWDTLYQIARRSSHGQ